MAVSDLLYDARMNMEGLRARRGDHDEPAVAAALDAVATVMFAMQVALDLPPGDPGAERILRELAQIPVTHLPQPARPGVPA